MFAAIFIRDLCEDALERVLRDQIVNCIFNRIAVEVGDDNMGRLQRGAVDGCGIRERFADFIAQRHLTL